MQRICFLAFASALLGASAFSFPAWAAPSDLSTEMSDAPAETAAEPQPKVRYAAAGRGNMGGGFIEFLFGGNGGGAPQRSIYPPGYGARDYPRYEVEPGVRQARGDAEWRGDRPVDPKFRRQVVEYDGGEQPGTIIIDTPNRFLYLVQEGGRAVRYGIGVGRPGFTWAGVKTVSMKREWPDWRPPDEMLKRRPDLPRYMPGGPDNPLGARALYLGSSLYRIHGSNEPWTIGTAVSSGCIRMRNEDVIDLYERVSVGTRVIVI
jgi:lipoprotein-anchoring transpeptidase ErfK/SrfK